MIELQCTEWRI